MLKGLLLLVLGVGCCLAADTRNIVQYLQDEGYSQLVDFLRVAGLTDTLEKGVFTIFAPTNDAFSKLQPSFVQKLFLDPMTLGNFLKQHVTSDTVIGPLIKNDELVTSLSGTKLRLNSYAGNLYTVEGVPLVGDDVVVANGVIHKINTALLPSNMTAAAYVATHDNNFRDLFAALTITQLFSQLEAPTGHFTIFAPTDKAFDAIKETLGSVINDGAKVAEILKYHVVDSTAYSLGLQDGQVLPTLHGSDLTVAIKNGTVTINGANVLRSDVDVTNGVIHVIDKVLLPPSS